MKIIVAMDKNRAIGFKNTIPWHIGSDLKKFKELTSNHPIVMGRKTFESIGKALPKRLNVVISRNKGRCKEVDQKGAVCVPTLARAKELLKDKWDETFVIGGGEIYKEFISEAEFLYITFVDTEIPEADAYFPEIPEYFELESSEYHSHENDDFPYEFKIYKNKRNSV